MDVALGLKARTGRAILVAVGGSVQRPVFVERRELALLPPGAFAPYHAFAGLAPAAARQSVEGSIAEAHRLARAGIEATVNRLRASGHEIRGCGVLVGAGMPAWSTDEILAVHVRMHQAEGELFREVLVAGVRTCRLRLETLPDNAALEEAAIALGVTAAALAARLAALGKSAGPPWGKDQKEAASAALLLLP